MSDKDLLIVGAGLGAFRVAEQLRRRGYCAKITILGAEPHRPYDRPPLSKGMLRGEIQSSEFPGTDELDVDWVLGSRAVSLDIGGNCVVADDGKSYGYSMLVLAPGGRARTLPHLGAGPGLHVLRTIEDAIALRASIQPDRRLIIIGAGFIGCEIAASARQMGASVDLVEALPAPLARVLGTQAGSKVSALHKHHGVRLHMGEMVAEILRNHEGVLSGVGFKNGTKIEGSDVVIGVGMVPEIEWLAGSGIALQDGIVCDSGGRTNVPNVFALGDAAQWWHELASENRRVEHWTTTTDQAAAIAANIAQDPADPPVRLTAAPYFWSDQYDTKIQGIGFIDPSDEIDELTIRGRSVLLYSREGVVRGVVGFSIPGAVMRTKSLIERRAPVREAIELLAA